MPLYFSMSPCENECRYFKVGNEHGPLRDCRRELSRREERVWTLMGRVVYN